MRYGILWTLLSLLLVSCSNLDFRHDHLSVGSGGEKVQRVAVFEFDFDRPTRGKIERGKIERPANAGQIVADIFAEHLLGSGRYQVVEQGRVASLLQQNDLQPSDLLASPDGRRIRDLLGVDGIVFGVVLEYGDWRSRMNWGGVSIFTARLVDVASGNIVWSISANRNIARIDAAMVTHAGAKTIIAKLDDAIER